MKLALKMKIIIIISIMSCMLLFHRTIANGSDNMKEYCVIPPFINRNVPPLVMLIMGRDHKLYYEAYNDASDIDEDGELDVGYKHSIDYYGYFDSYKCYIYDGSKFVPTRVTTNKYCGGTNEWSGNFLNWLSMSRMDVLRKVLYGGYRSTDTDSETVLEGVFIPQDAHSWGKEYAGDDSRLLTPFDAPKGSCKIPSTPVEWNKNNQILFVIYDDNKSGIFGKDHKDLLNSYSLCDYSNYSYINELDTTNNYNNLNRIDSGNYLLVAEFKVTSNNAGIWQFSIDSDDGSEVEIDGVVVASYYGAHGFCSCSNHSGSIYLAPGWHRIIVRLRENFGGDGVIVWYKKPRDIMWTKFGNSELTIRAPNIDNECRLKSKDFIVTGEPASGGGTVECKRHLFCVVSVSDGEPHKIRVLLNKSNRIWEWATKERPVCNDSLGRPDGEYFVRVKVCDPNVGLEDKCKQYPNGNYKPIGLLQKYGEGNGTKICSKTLKLCSTDNDCKNNEGICINQAPLYFGLITGSYTKNLSGGVLRKNIWSISDEIDLNTGIFKNSVGNKGSIIQTINKLRVIGFGYSSDHYYYYYNNCGWITTHALREGECKMWGNPIAEMMYEAERYFAGKKIPISDFTYSSLDDTGLDLPKPDWNDPYEISPWCAKPSMIVISDINPSYDSDKVPGSGFSSYSSGDLPNLDVEDLTKTIGDEENITNTIHFIGQSGNEYDFICSDKNIFNLGEIRGLCPEEPTKQGSYYSAALAYYGLTRFKNEINRPNITTYSVALSSPVPEIKIQVGSNIVTIVAIGKSVSGCANVYEYCKDKCNLTYDNNRGLIISNCSSDAYCPSNQIVDFYVTEITPTHGKFRINFEDVEQGADHDMDAIVTYEYEVIDNSHVKIKLSSDYASGCIDQVMGFIISGTSEDGLYLPVVDKDSKNQDNNTPEVVANMPLVWEKTFSVSSGSVATLLKNPLWYAAKWGGFEDINNNNKPDLQLEWDRDRNGIPDNYFFVANPLKLEKQLEKVFIDILNKVSSGTAVSVLSSGEGSGANLLQAIFYPKKTFTSGNISKEISWVGKMYNLWYYVDPFDKSSTIREDTDKNNELDLSNDKILNIRFDKNEDKTVVDKIDPVSNNLVETIDIEYFTNYLWEAGKKLFETDPANRVIYTNINNNRKIFDISNTSQLKPFMNVLNDIEAKKVISYIKGYEGVCANDVNKKCDNDSDCDIGDGCINNVRDRTVTIDNITNTWKLGDIIHSTPKIQSWMPLNEYHERYKDKTYEDFISSNDYKNRGMVYVGTNDGMLHAFKLGELKIIKDETNPNLKAKLTGTDLGKEEWAFIPKNALPYLKYLLDPDYCHLYYIDASPYIFDASINGNHDVDKTKDSWRTILIGSMRLGGACRNKNSNCVDCVKTPMDGVGYSSYFALDITEPNDPKLLWEFSDEELGFSTTGPIVVRIGDKDKNGKWFVLIASGPTGPIDTDQSEFKGKSDQKLKIFILDLRTGSLITTIDTGIEYAFGGSVIGTSVDLNDDYQDDVIYFSYVKKNDRNNTWTSGGVLRVVTTEKDKNGKIIYNDPTKWSWSKVIELDEPITTSIAFLRSKKNKEMWLFFGSGRYFYKNDDMDGQRRIYGVKEECYRPVDNVVIDNCSILKLTDLTNVTTIPNPLPSNLKGWYINLDPVDMQNYYGAERTIGYPVALPTGVVFFTTFKPTTDVCGYGGDSYIWAVDYKTGGDISQIRPSALRGKALLQLSTGEIKEIELSKAFTEKEGRRTIAFKGVGEGGITLLMPPNPIRRYIFIKEK